MKTRRTFLAGLVLAGVSGALVHGTIRAQSPVIPPPRPTPGGQTPEGPSLPDPEKRALEDNDKDMKKKVDRLYQLATELKEQVEKTDSSKVFSLGLVRKAEEIEKLARDIKNRAKG
jgi:hypothetical protein